MERYLATLNWLEQQNSNFCRLLKAWSNINSGTYHLAGLAKQQQELMDFAEQLNAEINIIELDPIMEVSDSGHLQAIPLGKAISIRQRPKAKKQVILAGHMDTVFGQDHRFQQVTEYDDGTWNGPGVTDMKGGLLVMLFALQALDRSPFAKNIGWEVLINPDEEIGSPASSPLFSERAAQFDFGLVFEPAMTPEGNMANIRKGSGKFAFVVKGKAAHAGRSFHKGRNAIAAAADLLLAVNELNGQREHVTLNVGRISGGGALNVVPDLAIFAVDVRVQQLDDQKWLQEQINAIVAKGNHLTDISVTLHGGFGRPPKMMTPRFQGLIDFISDTAEQLRIPMEWQPSGGVCDGNNLAAHGLPVADSMGVRGGGIHSEEEYIILDSLVERSQLAAMLLMRHASNDWDLS